MSALTVRLPNSVHESIKELAKKDGISVNQFIASAASEKMSAFLTLEYLRREAKSGKQSDFKHFLKLVHRELIRTSQAATILITAISAVVTFYMDSIQGAWKLLILTGAGTGLVLLLTLYWWRINAGVK